MKMQLKTLLLLIWQWVEALIQFYICLQLLKKLELISILKILIKFQKEFFQRLY